jgi:Domain of unknown function (DUF4340)
MKFRGLIIAVLVLLVLGGLLYWSDHHKPSEPAVPSSASTSVEILKFDSSSITGVSLSHKATAPVTLAKEDGDQWRITAPEGLPADKDAVSSLLGSLSSLNADRVVEDKASDLKPYGLDDPSLTLNIASKDGKERKLMLGDDTPAGSDVYAMVAGDPRVFTIASYNKTSVDKALNDLRDKRLVTVQPDQVSRVVFTKKAQSIEFARTKDGWQILRPNPIRADSSAVDEFVRSVSGARMDLSGTDNDRARAGFAGAAPLASVTLTGNQGSQTLDVRKSKDDYYAKSSAANGIYKVDSSLGTSLDKSLDDFRNKKIFDFGFEDPSRVEMHLGPKSWVLTRSGSDWWWNGKKIDPTGVDQIIEKLRDLTATLFPTSGFSTEEFDATVTSSDGKRTERVLFSKSANGYIAKRENEPSLYQLDSTSVSDLENAANALKPAAGSK